MDSEEAEGAARSKTTVGGPSLSARVVIALGGNERGGFGGAGLKQHSRASVCVRALGLRVALRCPGSRPADSSAALPAE